MIRQHKKMILLTSIATLLPILIGLLLWKQLPDSVATHWSTGNEPDGYSSKAFAVFGLPVIMLILHLVCVIATNIDPKANSINKKIFFIVLWICPVFSIIVCSTVYGYNLGYQFDIGFLCGLLIGVLYLILGNFLPTVKPNYTIGFRISWALNDADNWYHTHRFGGKCMVIGGDHPLSTVSFDLKKGEKLGILGGNGLGKSTLLKTLVGQLAPLSGEYNFGTNV